MLREYPEFKRFEAEKVYKKLNNSEKNFIEEYIKYRKARGLYSESKIADVRRRILQIIKILGKDYYSLDLKKLRELLVVINTSKLKNTTKNDIKVDLKNFLKFKFPDWSKSFSSLEDIRTETTSRDDRINHKNLILKEDIEKLVKHETKIYWKAFLLTQYEGGLRTGEVRLIKWDDIKFNVDEQISEINIFATKTKKARSIFVKESTFYLKKLKEEQENTTRKGIYVFPSKKDVNLPVDKTSVSCWFKRLSQKALGRYCWNYLLRHSRGTELYKLSREGKISRDTAKDFMGHSKDMSYFYEHLDSDTIKKMLKEQVYKLEELPESEKLELKKEIEEIKTILKTLLLKDVVEIHLLDKKIKNPQEMDVVELADLIIKNREKGELFFKPLT